jgi:replication-associated recombination protein RarA
MQKKNEMPPTKRGYAFDEVTSAMQKAIRRNDPKLAGYWAIELFESGYAKYVWMRLLTVSAEDCHGIVTKEIYALYESWEMANSRKKGSGRVFISKAVILLSCAPKSRDADHLTNLIYDANAVDIDQLQSDIVAARNSVIEIPEYALDCHTRRGRLGGAKKADFFIEEHKCLMPKQATLFDDFLFTPQS